MGVEVATTGCFQWSSSQPIIPHSHPPSSSHSLPSPSSSRRRCRSDVAATVGAVARGALVCRYMHRVNKSTLLGTSRSTKLYRTGSYEHPMPSPRRAHTIKRASSASLDASFSDEEFSKEIQELALRFQLSDDSGNDNFGRDCVDSESNKEESRDSEQNQKQLSFPVEPPWQDSPPEWHGRAGDDIIIERKANSVDLPLSLRIIKRKMKWEEGFREAGESAYCSVKKAFSSMVFIISELHSYSLQMREVLFTKDLQGILARVQNEIHASFVWLFQQVFSHTPTLMVYVMILLANFTVYSMGSSVAMASPPPTVSSHATVHTENVACATESQKNQNPKLDSSSLKSFFISSSTNGKSTSIGGHNGGGGGKVRPAASGTEGDGHLDRPNEFRTIVPDGGASQLSSPGTTGGETEYITGEEKELSLWNSIVDEARAMQASFIDSETLKQFVSPVNAKIEPEDHADYLRTELLYQIGLAQDPNNSLLLANYAQFLYLVAHDYERAEEYFKRATGVEEPRDPEAYSKYASFLWRARKDLWAAEETFLEAISADPNNSYYAANYANFLWNTGGDDTCFPLGPPDGTSPQ